MDPYEKARQTCLSMTRNLIINKNGSPFAVPVNYLELNIPHYPEIVKNPMDLGSVQARASAPATTVMLLRRPPCDTHRSSLLGNRKS